MATERNFGDDLDDMLGDAKRGANKFADDTRRTANEFEDDINKVKSDGKNVAIISHLTLIGWIIALVMNNNPKSEFASFYIRQMLGLMICSLILSFIPVVGWILSIILFVLWIISLIGALNGEMKLTPGIGHLFQDWFKSL